MSYEVISQKLLIIEALPGNANTAKIKTTKTIKTLGGVNRRRTVVDKLGSTFSAGRLPTDDVG